jgi:hypothetical protein
MQPHRLRHQHVPVQNARRSPIATPRDRKPTGLPTNSSAIETPVFACANASGTDGSVVFQDPVGGTSDEVYNHNAFILLCVPPSPEIPHGMIMLLKLGPALA